MSNNLEQIMDKIISENIEINCRGMNNLLNKISYNLIPLEQIDDTTGYKLLFSITKWLLLFLSNYKYYKYDPTLIINALNLYLKCIETFPPSARPGPPLLSFNSMLELGISSDSGISIVSMVPGFNSFNRFSSSSFVILSIMLSFTLDPLLSCYSPNFLHLLNT